MRTRAVVAGGAIALAVACGADWREGGGHAEQGPAGVRHYVLSEAPLLSIGGYDERPGHQLTFPAGALRLSDGRMVVAEAMGRELRYFDADGNLVVTAGGLGEGPNEFRGFSSIGRFVGDTIYVWDPGRLRALLFDRDGRVADVITISAWPAVVRHLTAGRPISVSPREAVVLTDRQVVVKPTFTPPLTATGLVPFRVPLIVFGTDGESWSEVGSFPAVDEWFLAAGIARYPAFGDLAHIAGGGAGVYIGSRRHGMIGRLLPWDGGMTQFGLGTERRAVTADHVQAVLERWLDRASPSLRERLGPYVDAMPVPDSMPFLSGLRVDAEGGVWVLEYVASSDLDQRWIALDPTGATLGSVTMAATLELMDLGQDYAIVAATDDLGVPEIRMHALVPVGGGS